MRRKRQRSTGQALVEFALAATLIFTLLSAAVDLGLLFFSIQAIRTAAQEGAMYGRVPVAVNSGGALQSVELDYEQIIMRIRGSAGTPSQGIVNLFDLNNNGQDDVTEGVLPNPGTANNPVNVTGPLTRATRPTTVIEIDNPYGTSANSLGSQCATTIANVDMRNEGKNCWVRVRLYYTYKFIFPLAPVFGNTVTFPVSYQIQIKSAFVG